MILFCVFFSFNFLSHFMYRTVYRAAVLAILLHDTRKFCGAWISLLITQFIEVIIICKGKHLCAKLTEKKRFGGGLKITFDQIEPVLARLSKVIRNW